MKILLPEETWKPGKNVLPADGNATVWCMPVSIGTHKQHVCLFACRTLYVTHTKVLRCIHPLLQDQAALVVRAQEACCMHDRLLDPCAA